MSRWWTAPALALTLATAGWCDGPPATRNPFGVTDAAEPAGDDLEKFARDVKLPGDNEDANAEAWAADAPRGRPGNLEGDWVSRWHSGGGTPNWLYGKAAVRVVKDRVYILFTDAGSSNLVEAVADSRGRLVGRWVVVGNANAGGRFVGQIVHHGRIDGVWSDNHARWDFRRRLHDGRSAE